MIKSAQQTCQSNECSQFGPVIHPVMQSFAASFLLLREIPFLPWNMIVLLGSGVPIAVAYAFFLSLGQMPLEA
jgi:hypothetical protein